MSKIGVIIQARMTSTRLPGKVLLPVHKQTNLTMLEAVLDRITKSKLINQVIIAMTINETDDPIVEMVNKYNNQNNVVCSVFRGSENDVLSRYYLAATESQLDHIVRVTSDCPLIDPKVVDQVVGFYMEHLEEYDYVSNTIERTYPRGLDLEVFSYQTLQQAYQRAIDLDEREHVTAHIYRHPKDFRVKAYTQLVDQSQYRLTIDTSADLDLVQRIYDELYLQDPNFGLSQIIDLLERHPDWVELNKDIEQKYSSQQHYINSMNK